MDIPLEIKARREILQKMLDYSSFGGDDRQSNLLWLIEDINHIIKTEGLQGQIKYDHDHSDLSHSDLSHSGHSNLPNTTSDSRE